jgi:hypothetical protein
VPKKDYNDATFEAFLRRYGRIYDRAANDKAIAEKESIVAHRIARINAAQRGGEKPKR